MLSADSKRMKVVLTTSSEAALAVGVASNSVWYVGQRFKLTLSETRNQFEDDFLESVVQPGS